MISVNYYKCLFTKGLFVACEVPPQIKTEKSGLGTRLLQSYFFLLMVTQLYSNMIGETIPDNDHTTPFYLQQYLAIYIYTIPEDFALGLFFLLVVESAMLETVLLHLFPGF